MKTREVVALSTFAAVTALASFVGSRVVRRRQPKVWYRMLRKPRQTPPDRIFGIVWPVLYGLSAYSGYRVWKRRAVPGAKLALGLWGTQLAFNAAWSPLFFSEHKARAALVDLGLNLASLLAYRARAARLDQTSAKLVNPYLGWLLFAGTINSGIVRRNPAWLAG